ncbi:Polymerase/histidinol phosphatase-like protein [Zopfochytrium polystomum]|nr:Polymerase/histidinol phosphatase-like protein [Zopfochytrium polystomum]
MISLHSHSAQFCKHATGGSLEDVVREAIRKGFAVYGLSEHMPRTRRQDLYPEEEGMTPEDTLKTYDSFYAEAQRLKRLYKNEISLLVGMETENIHEETLGELERLRRQFKLDYLVGSVHHVNGVPIDFDKTMCAVAEATAFARDPSLSSGTEALFLQYFDAQYEMLQSCLPEVIGHFDLIRIFRADFQLTDAVWTKIRRNIDFGVSYGGIFELNSRAWKKQLESAYPQKDVLAVRRLKSPVRR